MEAASTNKYQVLRWQMDKRNKPVALGQSLGQTLQFQGRGKTEGRKEGSKDLLLRKVERISKGRQKRRWLNKVKCRRPLLSQRDLKQDLALKKTWWLNKIFLLDWCAGCYETCLFLNTKLLMTNPVTRWQLLLLTFPLKHHNFKLRSGINFWGIELRD